MYWKEAINMLGGSVKMDTHGELVYSAGAEAPDARSAREKP